MGKLLDAWRNLNGVVLLTDINGGLHVGEMVDLEIDDDEDCLLLRLSRGTCMSFYESEVESIVPWIGKRKTVGQVRYVGNSYRVTFENGCIYDLLEITDEGFYKVYSDAIEDWALLPPQDFEVVWERGCLE